MWTDEQQQQQQQQQQQYTLVQREVNPTCKKNALYRLITILLTENSQVVRQYKIRQQKTVDRNAYFIYLEQENEINLFSDQGYQCIGKHLSVDEKYAEAASRRGARGFTCAHYTEEYQHPENSKKIVVHAYFDSQGQYAFSQVKMLPDQFMEMGSRLENAIKNNSSGGFKVLNELVLERSQRYTSAVNTAQDLQAALSQSSIDLISKKGRSAYVDKALQFLEAVKNINLYNDQEVDCRNRIVLNTLRMLESNERMTFQESIEVKESSRVTRDEKDKSSEATKPNLTSKTKKKKSKAIESDLSHSEKQQLADLEQQIDQFFLIKEPSVKEIIAADSTAEQLKLLLNNWVLFYQISGKLEAERETIVKRIEAKIAKLPSLIDQFKACALQGDLENVTLLFDKVNAQITWVSFNSFVRSVIHDKVEETLLNKRIAVCHFLFEVSEDYRSYITLRGFMADMTIGGSSDGIGRSLLIQAAIQSNLAAFNMLLDHGYNPNGPGLIYERRLVPNLRVLLCMKGFEEYVKQILQYGGSVDRERQIISDDRDTIQQAKFPRELRSIAQQSLSFMRNTLAPLPVDISQIFNDVALCRWDLLLAFKLGQYESVPLLVECTELPGVVAALAYAAIKKGNVMTRFIPNVIAGGVIYERDKERLEKASAIEVALMDQHELSDQVKFILWCKDDTNPSYLKALETLSCDIKQRCNEKPHQIEEALKVLEQEAKTKKNEVRESIVYYQACAFLLSETKKLSVNNAFKMMWYHYIMGEKAISAGNGNEHLGLMLLRRVIDIASTSTHSQTLKNQDLFKKAWIRIQGTPFDFTLPADHGVVSEQLQQPASPTLRFTLVDKKPLALLPAQDMAEDEDRPQIGKQKESVSLNK